MSEENVSQECRLKNIDQTRNYLIEELNQNESMSMKHKKVYKVFNYTKHLLISITYFNSFLLLLRQLVFLRNYRSAIGLKICVITVGIEKYKSIIKKKEKKKNDKILTFAKSTINSVEVLISKALIDLNNSHNKFFLMCQKNFMIRKKKQKIPMTNKSLHYI